MTTSVPGTTVIQEEESKEEKKPDARFLTNEEQALMATKNLSVRQIAEEFKTSPGAVRGWLLGQQLLSPKTKEKLLSL